MRCSCSLCVVSCLLAGACCLIYDGGCSFLFVVRCASFVARSSLLRLVCSL